jgi:hypothetical protein
MNALLLHSFHNMSRAQPLITPEELQCLLGSTSARSGKPGHSTGLHPQSLHVGAALWLLKGVFLYAVLMSPDASQLVNSSRYLALRGGLELVCVIAFWGAAIHPRGRTLAGASLLVASTTLLMDAMTLLAFAG